jgi:hypothetical protein
MSRMMKSHSLFLGYGLNRWYLRVILDCVWRGARWGRNSGLSCQCLIPSMSDRGFAAVVQPVTAPLEEYVDQLNAALISASRITGEQS